MSKLNKTRTYRGALSVSTAVVVVEVLVYIKDEVGDAAIWVGDFAQCCCRTVGDEGLSGSPVVAWKQDDLRRSTVLVSVKVSSPVFFKLTRHYEWL